MTRDINDLKGFSKSHPFLALSFLILMFSMAGIPPFSGFFGKWMVFSAAVHSGLISLAVIGVLTSVVGAFYYLRIIKNMYFDEIEAELDIFNNKTLHLLLFLVLIPTVGFGLFLNWGVIQFNPDNFL